MRARYSAAGISGLNTLVSGNYLGLQPGVSKNRRQDFTGLENPPPTPPGVPGLRFKLIAAQAGGLGPGAAIIYKGITVGKLETRVFHPDTGEVEFNAFIEDAYARLVDERTLFYKAGGLDLKVGAEGVQLGGGTLESILSASVTFTDPAEKTSAAETAPGRPEFRSLCRFRRGEQAQAQSHATLSAALRRQRARAQFGRAGRVSRHPRRQRRGRIFQIPSGRS